MPYSDELVALLREWLPTREPYEQEQVTAATDAMLVIARYLNHATGHQQIYADPSVIREIVADLEWLASRLDQSVQQLALGASELRQEAGTADRAGIAARLEMQLGHAQARHQSYANAMSVAADLARELEDEAGEKTGPDG